MDEPNRIDAPIEARAREGVVGWSLLAKRLRRPTPWFVGLSVATVASLAGAAYLWTLIPGAEPAPSPRGQFRFDEVPVVERDVQGNNTTFVVQPWFSNKAEAPLGSIRLVVYATNVARGVAEQTIAQEAGALDAMTTRNASMEFHLNNTHDYRLEILVLEDGFLVARGYGTIGFVPAYDSDEGFDVFSRGLQVGPFEYRYLER